MPSIKDLIDRVVSVADAASAIIPGASLIGDGAEMASKIIDLIDGLKKDVPVEQQGELQAARKKLADAVADKADATSARLRGK